MRSAVFAAAAVAVLLSSGAAFSQAGPADPLAPGAGADEAKTAAPDAAKPEKKKTPARRKRAGERLLEVTVHNDRSVGLVELKVGPAGAADLNKVAGPLAFGRKTVVRLKHAKDCLYDIHAHFADEADTDQAGVDLCKDKAINLTD